MKTFKEYMAEMEVRDPAGHLIKIKKLVYRGADMKLHSAYPGKSSSSGGGGGSAGGTNGGGA